MLIRWSEQTVRWFWNASEYTGFHAKLRELLLPRLTKRDTFCDLGCGAGLIDFALAGDIGKITCVDEDSTALQTVALAAARLGVRNIETVHGDARTLMGRWDHLLLSFFGQAEDYVPRYLPLCRESLIALVHGYDQMRFGPEEYRKPKCNTVEHTKEVLAAAGVPYELIPAQLEYGQPFPDWGDAADFIRAYMQDVPEGQIQDYLGRMLQKIDHPEYRYYLPKEKPFGIFIIKGSGGA